MKIEQARAGNLGQVVGPCPHCRHQVTFETVGINDVASVDGELGIRRCPKNDCHGSLFILRDRISRVFTSFPPMTIDFDITDVPAPVADCLREAISCQANGEKTASAIMVRKTLEEICHDKHAQGKDLRDRVKSLGTQIVVPPALLSGMDTLRLLGNDAAHVEARVFTEVGDKELIVAIKFTKEILKAVYQYDNLLSELESLKFNGKT